MAFFKIQKVSSRGKSRFKAIVRKKNGANKEESKSKTFDHEVFAQKWAETTLNKYEGKIHSYPSGSIVFTNIETPKLTDESSIKDIVNEFIKLDKQAPKPHSKTYISSLNLLIQYDIALISPKHLNWNFLVQYCNERLETASPCTVSIELSALRTALKNLGSQFTLDLNHDVITKLRPQLRESGYIAYSNVRTRRLNNGEYKKILEILQEYEQSNKVTTNYSAAFKLYIRTCLRRFELLSLTWEDLDYDRSLIKVSEYKKTQRGAVYVTRFIPFTKKMKLILEKIKPNDARDSDKIFHILPASFTTVFSRLMKDNNIKDLHLHDLRREGVSRYLESGLSTHEVAVFTGHKDLSMIHRVYSQINAVKLTSKVDLSMSINNAYIATANHNKIAA